MTKEKLIFFGETFLKANKDSKNTNIYEFVNEALKLLKQEPCEDAVDRKAVLSMAKSYNTDGWNAYTPLVVDVEDIEDLPSVTPTQKWIPCSEMLPKKNDWYLVTVKQGYVTTALGGGGVSKYWEIVTAWQPLPKPYKAEMEDEDGSN